MEPTASQVADPGRSVRGCAAVSEGKNYDRCKSVMIIAGEASGDLHGAHLVRAMSAAEPNLAFFGIGGSHLKNAGVDIRVDNAQIAVVGISEALVKLTVLLRALRTVKNDLKRRRPDLLIVIDFPDFNLMAAAQAKRLGIPVLYYISPQVWAWRTNRVKKIKRLVDHMVVIFPFEVAFYKRRAVPVTFVGHPLLDHVSSQKPGAGSLTVTEGDLVIGLLPGSRNEEVKRLFPVMVKVAETISRQFVHAVFAVPVAASVDRNLVDNALKGSPARFVVLQADISAVLEKASLVITASGTVTLEAALAGTPMIVVYKVSRLSYWIGRCLVRVKHIGLANLVAGREIVPELIQADASAERISRLAISLLRDKKALLEMREELGRVARSLGTPGASRRAAQAALHLLMRA